MQMATNTSGQQQSALVSQLSNKIKA